MTKLRFLSNLLLCATVVSASTLLAACGDDTTPVADDMSTTRDLTAVVRDMTQPVNADMAGFMMVEGCAFADYIDLSAPAATRTITPWDTSLGKKCIIIAKGQSVTWQGVPDPSHPLGATGGTSPNPITNVATTAFPSVGTYGFDCTIHHSLMHGAIWVR